MARRLGKRPPDLLRRPGKIGHPSPARRDRSERQVEGLVAVNRPGASVAGGWPPSAVIGLRISATESLPLRIEEMRADDFDLGVGRGFGEKVHRPHPPPDLLVAALKVPARGSADQGKSTRKDSPDHHETGRFRPTDNLLAFLEAV